MNTKIMIGACLSIASFTSAADSNITNYIEIGHSAQESDDFSGDFKGAELAASYQLSDNFFFATKYISTKDKRDFKNDRKTAGIGYVFSTDENSAWYTQLDVVNVEIGRDYAASFNETGYQVGVGYQLDFMENWTFDAEIKYLNTGEVDSTYGDYSLTMLSMGAAYEFTEALWLYGDYEYESDGERIAFGLRFSF